MKKIPAALALLAALSGCGSLVLQDDAPSRIEAALQAFSAHVSAMEADRIVTSFTTDGEIQDGAAPPAKAPDAIRAAFTSRAGAKIEENVFKGSSLQVVGPSALQSGAFHRKTRLPDGTVVESTGTFEAEWERQADGSWLISRLTMNPLPFKPNEAGAVP